MKAHSSIPPLNQKGDYRLQKSPSRLEEERAPSVPEEDQEQRYHQFSKGQGRSAVREKT
jgi:hypothetical protein